MNAAIKAANPQCIIRRTTVYARKRYSSAEHRLARFG
jgi:hypothetical protein